MRMTKSRTKPTANHLSATEPELLTFMDHLQELKGRFFWVAVYFVVASGLAYPRFQDIVHVLLAPLGKQELYYMTPAGGLSFIIKVCMYVGVIAILPVMIYHLYKFVTPVMKRTTSRAVFGYTTASTLLALAGIAFAYFFSLPAALHFLTNINLDQISSMLTIDSYMSFVIAYVLGGALLFQTPLIMLIINSITPLTPGKLMNYQRHMIVVSFIIAAIISPTPDVVNQTILAAPMVVMYQVGVILVWLRNRRRKARPAAVYTTYTVPPASSVPVQPVVVPTTRVPVPVAAAAQMSHGRVFDIAAPRVQRPAPVSHGGMVQRSAGRAMDIGVRPRQTRPTPERFVNPLRRQQQGPRMGVSEARRPVAIRGLIPTI